MTVRKNRGLVRRSGVAREGGFTLIELLVVISIVAILAAMIMPIGNSVARQRDQNTCFFNLKTLGMALENYRQDFRGFPLDITEDVDWGDNGGITKGLGLYTLYYLTSGQGVPQNDRGTYLKSRKFYHCPRSPVEDLPAQFDVRGLPTDAALGGWNNYDGPIDDPHYRRVRPDLGLPDERQLIQPYPSPTTVVTWCDFHYRSGRSVPEPGDRVLVLWVDQTVDWVHVRHEDGEFLHPALATQAMARACREE